MNRVGKNAVRFMDSENTLIIVYSFSGCACAKQALSAAGQSRKQDADPVAVTRGGEFYV